MTHQDNVLPFPAAGGERRSSELKAPAQLCADLHTPAANKDQAVQASSIAGADFSICDVSEALSGNRVVIHYQPQYCISSGENIAAEALVRLVDADGNLVYPDRFIDEVECSNLIVPMGRAVISQVCADLAMMRDSQLPLNRLAINLAANQLNLDLGLAEFVQTELKRHNLTHGDIEFELTERQGFSAASVGASQLKALASRGCTVVLDDFGSGYSGAESLKDMPFSAIKIDRTVVRDAAYVQASLGMLKGVLTLASSLGLEVIAEGIETPLQQELLGTLGFRWGQGFGYARPMSVDALTSFLINHNDWPLQCVVD